MTDLLKLAERGEAGEFVEENDIVSTIFGGDYDFAWRWNMANGHVLTSLDAAKALHDAVLPGWEYQITKGKDDFSAIVCNGSDFIGDDSPVIRAAHNATNPAAAWVAAILRAKASDLVAPPQKIEIPGEKD